MSGPRRRVVLLALAVGLASASAAPAEEYGPDLETYLALIDRYQRGDAYGPVREAASWGPIWIEDTVDRLLEWCRDAPGGGSPLHVRAAQGAFLIHTHAALAERDLGLRPRDHEEHADAAWQLLRWFRDRYHRNPGSWPSEARGLRPRDFYLALASSELVAARYDVARELARESLRGEGHDPEMRLLMGCALETEALVLRQSEGRWHDPTLREAERRFREALDEDPSLAEARLRLGWVLARRGRPREARPLLEAIAEDPGDPGRQALAWLFLGATHEESRKLSAAVAAYRRAVALAPHLQAAQIALAHALEESAGDEAARVVLGRFFTERSRSWVREDPWNDYPFGPPELRLRPFGVLLERLCAR